MTVTADNAADGTGTLTAGNAKLVISLLQSTAGGSPTVLDTKTIKVTLTAAGAVFIADLQLQFTSMEIDGGHTSNRAQLLRRRFEYRRGQPRVFHPTDDPLRRRG